MSLKDLTYGIGERFCRYGPKDIVFVDGDDPALGVIQRGFFGVYKVLTIPLSQDRLDRYEVVARNRICPGKTFSSKTRYCLGWEFRDEKITDVRADSFDFANGYFSQEV